jgi:hypothetical protein
MNTSRVDLIPVEQFEEISIYAPKWKDKFFKLWNTKSPLNATPGQ